MSPVRPIRRYVTGRPIAAVLPMCRTAGWYHWTREGLLVTRRVVWVVCGALLLGACAATETTRGEDGTPPVAVAGTKAASGIVTVVAAGDIADDADDGRGTARLIRSMAPDAVLALGDNAYDDGSATEYREKYDPTWGRFKAITRPVPGNHEYHTRGAAGYFEYFRKQVRGNAYYAWDAGSWRMYALNCEIDCGPGSAQLTWLRADLANHANRPALAYVHQPLFTCSTKHGPYQLLKPVWAALQRRSGRIMLAGHNHSYERFAQQDSTGARDADGLRQFVVGTGGKGNYELESSCRHRQAGNDTASGVLKLELGSRFYWWQFISVGGRVLDEGRGSAT